MKLPIEISPNPLVTSTIEVRYYSKIGSNKLFNLVYKAFMQELPNFEQNTLPQGIKETNPQFKYAPDYILSNENYKLSFSNNVLSFENVAEYKLWGNYFPFISKSIKAFFELGHIDYVERIGVRYASVLDKTQSASEVINDVPAINVEGYDQKFEHYRSNLKKDNISILLQIFDNAKAAKNGVNSSGVYIDIDASFTGKLDKNEGAFLDEVLKYVDKLHSIEKELFFSLMKPEYLSTLNPKY